MWRVLPHIFAEKPLKIPGVICQPICKSKEAENYLTLFETAFRFIATLSFSPRCIFFQFRQKIVERPPVNTVSQFLLVQYHRAAIEALKYLIPKLRICARIDDNAANGCVENLFLLFFSKV